MNDQSKTDDGAGQGIVVTPQKIDQAIELIVTNQLRFERIYVTSQLRFERIHLIDEKYDFQVGWLATRAARIFLEDHCGMDEAEVIRRCNIRYAESRYPVDPRSAVPPLPVTKWDLWRHAFQSLVCRLLGRQPPAPLKGGSRDLYH